jgi:hypothetical protein
MWGREIEVFSQRGAARRIIMDYVRLELFSEVGDGMKG